MTGLQTPDVVVVVDFQDEVISSEELQLCSTRVPRDTNEL